MRRLATVKSLLSIAMGSNTPSRLSIMAVVTSILCSRPDRDGGGGMIDSDGLTRMVTHIPHTDNLLPTHMDHATHRPTLIGHTPPSHRYAR